MPCELHEVFVRGSALIRVGTSSERPAACCHAKQFWEIFVNQLYFAFYFLTCGMHLPATPTLPANATDLSIGQVHQTELRLAQQGECSQRIGPFATQDTAWRRQQNAKREGYNVSGVFPCYDSYGTRGYCFNVFFSCE